MAGAPFDPACCKSGCGRPSRSASAARSTGTIQRSEPGWSGQNVSHLASAEKDQGPELALTPARYSSLPLPSDRVQASVFPDRNARNSLSAVQVGSKSGSAPEVTRVKVSRLRSYTKRFGFNPGIMEAAVRGRGAY